MALMTASVSSLKPSFLGTAVKRRKPRWERAEEPKEPASHEKRDGDTLIAVESSNMRHTCDDARIVDLCIEDIHREGRGAINDEISGLEDASHKKIDELVRTAAHCRKRARV